jgi:hypothetical protein
MKNQEATWDSLPIEIKEKMLERQFEQTGKKNENVFIKKINSNFEKEGFEWERTKEGNNFWFEVLEYSDFDKFFRMYPKPIFTPIEKKLNDTYNLLGIIKKNKEQIKFIYKTYYDFENFELPERKYKEVKKMKKQNKKLLKELFKLYENEK